MGLATNNTANMINTQTLKLEQDIFNELKFNKAPMAEVVEALRQYKATLEPNATAYNADVEKFILSLCKVDTDLHHYLGTEVYLAQQYLDKEAKAKHAQEMADKGYIPCREWNGYEGPAELVGKKQMDWMTVNINKVGKIIKSLVKVEDQGRTKIYEPFFIPKGKRTRGYYLYNMGACFYKAIN